MHDIMHDIMRDIAVNENEKSKVPAKPRGPDGANLRFRVALSHRHQLTSRDHRHGASASCGVSVPHFTDPWGWKAE